MRRLLLAALLALIPLGPARGSVINENKEYPKFHIGVTGLSATIQKGHVVTVESVAPNTPAAGKFNKGDVILAAGGRPLEGEDPRVPLGQALGAAEAADGKLILTIQRAGGVMKVTVTIPVLGAYSKTWPLDCPKSKRIVQQTAEYIVESKMCEKRSIGNMLSGLFLLSTGDDKYLPVVAQQARMIAAKPTPPAGSNWPRGYEGMLMAEYYLRTGDASVLPGLKKLCDGMVLSQVSSGWTHGGLGSDNSGGYVQSGLMNPAGVPILAAIILARECGVEVDEPMFQRALLFFYRMAGHGNVCYGDHRPELMWPGTNGKNGMLACTLQLLDEECYQQAARHMGLLMADSYYEHEAGHTGGGFNVIWRGLGSVHLPKDRQHHYRRQMDTLAWYYDICRLPGGGFSMLPFPEQRYGGAEWGAGGMGLTFTAPLRTLRITGAPKTKYSKKQTAPELPWGRQRDLEFFRTDYCEGFGREEMTPHEINLSVLKAKTAPVALCAKMLRHYSPMVRIWASRKLGDSDAAVAEIAKTLQHPDPRVRRAGMDCISLYDNWSRSSKGSLPAAVVSRKLVPLFEKTLTDPEASGWEIDGALYALGRAEPADIRRNLPTVLQFSRHPEWYLRESAFWTIVGLHQAIKPEEFLLLTDIYARETQVFARSSADGGFKQLLKSDGVKLDPATMQKAAAKMGWTLHGATLSQGQGVPGKHEVAHRTMMIVKHFDPKVYGMMLDDFEKYLAYWEPYHQHSVWLITGSNWQPGLLKILEGLGPDGKRLCAALKAAIAKYRTFDKKRIPKHGADLEEATRKAIAAWEAKHGKAN